MVIPLLVERIMLRLAISRKNNEKKRIVSYTRPEKQQSIYIHIAEIFVLNVALNEDLCMDIDEYQSIFNAAL